MKDMTNNKKPNAATSALDTETAKKIAEHYCHAKAKHPYFADTLFEEQDAEMIRGSLRGWRFQLQDQLETGVLPAETLISCEVCEAADAFARGDTAHAVEKCYDVIAVLLRMVDVLEDRQRLGKLKEETEEKK